MQLSPKARRNIGRIIPFSIIWLATGWVFLFSEGVVTGHRNLTPDEAVTLTVPVFIFASFASVCVGALVGLVELVVLEKRFRNYSFTAKVVYKFLLYLGMMLVINVIAFPIARSIEVGQSVFSAAVWATTGNYFQSLVFLNTMVQIVFQLTLSVIYAAASEHLGHQVLLNLISGKYHKPVIEARIFMFLDMKHSTTIAEQLGHKQYFDLLQQYYELMSDAIIKHYGEVYQYIGDEVVVTWPAQRGLANNNCLQCFAAIKARLQQRTAHFEAAFGAVPDFKAGLHMGEVSAGEIGALKKEVVFTGDVLNTTARIQGQCAAHGTDLIISDQLYQGLQHPRAVRTRPIGALTLKGKTQPVPLHAVQLPLQNQQPG